MKALFFYPQVELSYRPMSAPLGIMSIASFLNVNGHEAQICTEVSSAKKIRRRISLFQPDMIGISVISFKYIKSALFISDIAKKMGCTVVWGGTMASVIPQLALESGLIDFVSLREGELTWLAMADAFDRSKPFDDIKGLAFIKDGAFCQNEPQELLDLSILPPLDWTLIDPSKYFTASYGCKKSVHIYWSKGCVGNCTFCYNGDFNCSKRRQRPVSVLVREMKYLVETYGVDGFEFTDDLMFANPMQARELCEAIIDNDIHVCWTGYERIGIINDFEDYQLLYKAGCRCLMFGIETGSKRIQKSIHKLIPEEKIVDNVNMCARAGIIPLTTFMMAFPGETSEDIRDTIQLLNKFDNSIGVLNLLTPQPGTIIYDELVAADKLVPLETLKQFSKIRWGDRLYVNTSAVKKKELYAIANYYSIKGMIFTNDNTPEKHLFDTVKNVLGIMADKGPVEFFRLGFYILFNFLSFFTVFFHPLIRKKYSLYFKKDSKPNT